MYRTASIVMIVLNIAAAAFNLWILATIPSVVAPLNVLAATLCVVSARILIGGFGKMNDLTAHQRGRARMRGY